MASIKGPSAIKEHRDEQVYNQKQLGRTEIASLVISTLQGVLLQRDDSPPSPVEESTYLIGRWSILDSLSLVTLVVDLEQRLNEEYDVALTLADDRAMSQKNSPFRTVQSLTDYICLLFEEQRQDDGI